MLGIPILVLCSVGLSGGRSSHGRSRGGCGTEIAIYEYSIRYLWSSTGELGLTDAYPVES